MTDQKILSAVQSSVNETKNDNQENLAKLLSDYWMASSSVPPTDKQIAAGAALSKYVAELSSIATIKALVKLGVLDIG